MCSFEHVFVGPDERHRKTKRLTNKEAYLNSFGQFYFEFYTPTTGFVLTFTTLLGTYNIHCCYLQWALNVTVCNGKSLEYGTYTKPWSMRLFVGEIIKRAEIIAWSTVIRIRCSTCHLSRWAGTKATHTQTRRVSTTMKKNTPYIPKHTHKLTYGPTREKRCSLKKSDSPLEKIRWQQHQNN